MDRPEIVLTGVLAGSLIGTAIGTFFMEFQILGTVLGGALGGYISWIVMPKFIVTEQKKVKDNEMNQDFDYLEMIEKLPENKQRKFVTWSINIVEKDSELNDEKLNFIQALKKQIEQLQEKVNK